MAKKPFNVRLDDELMRQIQDAAKAGGITVSDVIRDALIKQLGKPDPVTEIKELVKLQLKMYRGFMAKLDVIIDLMRKGKSED